MPEAADFTVVLQAAPRRDSEAGSADLARLMSSLVFHLAPHSALRSVNVMLAVNASPATGLVQAHLAFGREVMAAMTAPPGLQTAALVTAMEITRIDLLIDLPTGLITGLAFCRVQDGQVGVGQVQDGSVLTILDIPMTTVTAITAPIPTMLEMGRMPMTAMRHRQMNRVRRRLISPTGSRMTRRIRWIYRLRLVHRLLR